MRHKSENLSLRSWMMHSSASCKSTHLKLFTFDWITQEESGRREPRAQKTPTHVDGVGTEQHCVFTSLSRPRRPTTCGKHVLLFPPPAPGGVNKCPLQHFLLVFTSKCWLNVALLTPRKPNTHVCRHCIHWVCAMQWLPIRLNHRIAWRACKPVARCNQQDTRHVWSHPNEAYPAAIGWSQCLFWKTK